ncbi:MAG TPA: hypothetical protein VKX49_18185 [Bryobacteraceae bacterium]|nr:hypothetical protein [Bryobacteraceae bacterium]
MSTKQASWSRRRAIPMGERLVDRLLKVVSAVDASADRPAGDQRKYIKGMPWMGIKRRV